MQNKELIKLIKEYQTGQTENFDLIYKEYRKLLYHYGSKTGDKEAVYDLSAFLSELLLKINTSKFAVNDSEDLHRYIAVCLRNEYYSTLKRIKANNFYCCELTNDIPEQPKDIDNRIFIRECLSLVTETQREILILRYFYDFSDYEISEKLHISRQAVNKARNKGIETIREFYKF